MLPTYRISILDDENGVDFVSFVDKPAIKRNFVAFKENVKVSFNEELRIITTPVLIPNQPIYRNDENGEYYLIALEEDVEKIYNKYIIDGKLNSLNLMHTKGTELTTKEAYLMEVFLADKRRGIKAPDAFSDLPNMTWFASFKINSDSLWSDIKDGKINGVSIEGQLGIIDLEDDQDYNEALAAYNELEKIINKIIK